MPLWLGAWRTVLAGAARHTAPERLAVRRHRQHLRRRQQHRRRDRPAGRQRQAARSPVTKPGRDRDGRTESRCVPGQRLRRLAGDRRSRPAAGSWLPPERRAARSSAGAPRIWPQGPIWQLQVQPSNTSTRSSPDRLLVHAELVLRRHVDLAGAAADRQRLPATDRLEATARRVDARGIADGRRQRGLAVDLGASHRPRVGRRDDRTDRQANPDGGSRSRRRRSSTARSSRERCTASRAGHSLP